MNTFYIYHCSENTDLEKQLEDIKAFHGVNQKDYLEHGLHEVKLKDDRTATVETNVDKDSDLISIEVYL